MVDVYQDDFSVLPADKEEAKETTDHTYDLQDIKPLNYQSSMGKRISCIRIMPKIQSYDHVPRLVCVCARDNTNFDEKIELFNRSMRFSLLLYDIDDMSALDPILEIQSPIEVTTFEFHPKKYDILIGGCLNGQIVRWKIDDALRDAGVLNKKGKNIKPESDRVPIVKPFRFSSLAQVSDPNL